MSTKAAVCPACGDPNRPGCLAAIGNLIKWGVILFVGLVVLLMYRGCNPPDDVEPTPPAPVIQVKPPTLDELRKRVASTDPKKQPIEALQNANSLIKHYPDSPEAIEAKKNIAELTAAAAARIEADKKAAIAAAEKAAAESAAQAKNALARLRKKNDEMQGVTFYEPNNAAHRGGTTFSLYMVKDPARAPYIRRIWRYRGGSWLFVQNIIVKIDDAAPVKFGAGAAEREVGGPGITEFRDIPLQPDEELFLALMASGKVVKVRFEGRNTYYDHTLSSAEKQGIKDVLLARDALK